MSIASKAKEAYDNGDYAEVVKLVSAAMETSDVSTEATMYLGKAQTQLNGEGELEEAIKNLKKVVDAPDASLEAKVALADAHEKAKQHQEALDLYQSVEEDARGDEAKQDVVVDSLCGLATTQTAMGDVEAAEATWKRVLDEFTLDKYRRLKVLTAYVDLQVSAEQRTVRDRLTARIGAEEQLLRRGLTDAEERRLERRVEADYADEAMEWSNDSASYTLQEIVMNTSPVPKYYRYHELYLKRNLKAVQAAAPGSRDRQERRQLALAFCRRMIAGPGKGKPGGCAGSYPYETALRLFEIEEEVVGGGVAHRSTGRAAAPGGVTSPRQTEQQIGSGIWLGVDRSGVDFSNAFALGMEGIAQRCAHSFPWNGPAQVHLALAMARREDNFLGPNARPRRKMIIKSALYPEVAAGSSLQELNRGLSRGVQTAAGWILLSQLYLDDKRPQQALMAAQNGIRWVKRRSERGSEPMTQAGLMLRLHAAQALQDMEKLQEALVTYNVLFDFVSEGQTAFTHVAGLPSVSIRQECARGIAKTLLLQGNVQTAKMKYEGILGKALLGHSPGEHWAHAEYGWILYLEGDHKGAIKNLRTALQVADACHNVMEAAVADYHYRLGRIYWAVGRKHRTDRKYAYNEFMDSARVDGPQQPAAFVWLGHYYREVAVDMQIANRCYQRAVQLDPRQEHEDVKEAVEQGLVKAAAEDSSYSYTDILVKMNREDLQQATVQLLTQLQGYRKTTTL